MLWNSKEHLVSMAVYIYAFTTVRSHSISHFFWLDFNICVKKEKIIVLREVAWMSLPWWLQPSFFGDIIYSFFPIDIQLINTSAGEFWVVMSRINTGGGKSDTPAEFCPKLANICETASVTCQWGFSAVHFDDMPLEILCVLTRSYPLWELHWLFRLESMDIHAQNQQCRLFASHSFEFVLSKGTYKMLASGGEANSHFGFALSSILANFNTWSCSPNQ